VYAFYPVGHACGSQVYEAFVLLHQNEFNAWIQDLFQYDTALSCASLVKLCNLLMLLE
jgi:hypothetical protein